MLEDRFNWRLFRPTGTNRRLVGHVSRVTIYAAFVCVFLPQPALAANPDVISFEAAQALRAQTSSAQSARNAELHAATAQADAAAHLYRPTVALDAQWIRYQKTFDISLLGALDQAESAAGQLLPAIIADLPGIPGDILASIDARLREALPEFFAQLPDSVRLRTSQNSFRPVVTAVLPLYTGGALAAGRDAANANVGLARALRDQTSDLDRVQLVRQYFGLVLTEQAVKTAVATRDGFDDHLANAQAMEREGLISTAYRLQVQVARDAAQRQVDRAQLEHDTALRSLSRTLEITGSITPSSPLFVDRAPLPPVEEFIKQGLADHPLIAQASSMQDMAGAGVDLARSRYRPKVFAFGTYNLDRSNALPIEPDWAFGIGLRYELFSSLDRKSTLAAALARSEAAAHGREEARDAVEQLIIRTYNLAEASRREFVSLDSSLAAAEENLRVQDIAFREGEAPASALVDARNLLGAAQLQRCAAAYEYVLSLATLLTASGKPDTFILRQRSSDPVIVQ